MDLVIYLQKIFLLISPVLLPFSSTPQVESKISISPLISTDYYERLSLMKNILEAKQEDFTAKLTKKVETNKNKPDPKDVPAEQVDFRNQLKNRGSVKTKVDQKFKPQQVDFRTQLKNQGKQFHLK